MKITSKNYGDGSFVEIESAKIKDDYRIKMIRNNAITGLLAPSLMRLDNSLKLSFRVDGLTSLNDYLRREAFTGRVLEHFLRKLVELVSGMTRYLLYPDELVISMSGIYYSRALDEFMFMYVPGERESFSVKLKKLFEEMMLIYDHTDSKDVIYLYRIYSKLLQDNFTPRLFAGCLEKRDAENEAFILEDGRFVRGPDDGGYVEGDNFNAGNNNFVNNNFLNDTFSGTDKEEKRLNSEILDIAVPVAVVLLATVTLLIIFGFAAVKFCIVIGILFSVYIFLILKNNRDDDEIDSSMREYFEAAGEGEGGALVPRGTETDAETGAEIRTEIRAGVSEKEVAIREEKNSFLVISTLAKYQPYMLKEGLNHIGRSRDMDYSIPSEGISRAHAVLNLTGGELMIRDEGSTNGTFINNKRINTGVWTNIFCGCLIRLGTEEFFLTKNEAE